MVLSEGYRKGSGMQHWLEAEHQIASSPRQTAEVVQELITRIEPRLHYQRSLRRSKVL
jgi:hypothetical protein